jgi:replication factor C subunit 1
VNGVGKTLLVELLLKKHDYNIINLSIDDDRDKETINQTIKPLLRTKKTFDGQENCLVVSDIDSSGGDYGFISTLLDCMKETQIPIICICDDRYNQNIKPILNYCVDFKLAKPNYDDIYRVVYKVVTTENIKISKQGIDKLYEQANGDIRFILNSLQMNIRDKTVNISKNVTSTNIFDTTGQLFTNTVSIDDKFNIYWLSHDIHTLMIQENYINNTLNIGCPAKKMTNLHDSASALSDADLFDTMVNGCNWEFESYVALSTIKATSCCNKKGHIKFPQFFGKISTINKNRREKKNIMDNLSRFTNIK